MKRKETFSIMGRIKSLSHAVRGLADMFSTEHNAWLHLIATIVALDLAWWLRVSSVEFALILISIVLVWIAEAFNTVLEIMADLVVGQRYSRLVKRAKDIAASAVLIAALGALVLGLMILGPHLYNRLQAF